MSHQQNEDKCHVSFTEVASTKPALFLLSYTKISLNKRWLQRVAEISKVWEFWDYKFQTKCWLQYIYIYIIHISLYICNYFWTGISFFCNHRVFSQQKTGLTNKVIGFLFTRRQVGQKILPSDFLKEGDLVDVHGMAPQFWWWNDPSSFFVFLGTSDDLCVCVAPPWL